MKKKIPKLIKLTVISYVTVTLLVLIMGSIDFQRVESGKKPLFTTGGVGMADGGSVEYFGFLYVLKDQARFARRPKPDWARSSGWAYDVGPKIFYLLDPICPWLNYKENIKLVIDESKVSSEDYEAYLSYKKEIETAEQTDQHE